MSKKQSFGKQLNWIQHLLKRPDVYIGSVGNISDIEWVAVEDETGSVRMERREGIWNEGFERTHMELVSNAIDNKWRSEEENIPMSKIEFTVNSETGEASIYNDGAFIPIEKHDFKYTDPNTNCKETKRLYPHQLYFGELLSSTNYNDDEDRKTSGRYGMGAKATNVFSLMFMVEGVDPNNGLKYKCIYRNNRSQVSEPIITGSKVKKGYTRITWKPDFKRFELEEYTVNYIDLFRKHAHDCAMVTKIPVWFNGKKIVMKDLKTYAKLFLPKNSNMMSFASEEYEIVLAEQSQEISEQQGFNHISYVNGIFTRDGGVHVDSWRTTLLGSIRDAMNKSKKTEIKVTLKDVDMYFILFVRCELDKPEFNSQTKHCLRSPKPKAVKPTPQQISTMMKWEFVFFLTEKLKYRENLKVKRTDGTQRSIVGLGNKLDDANWATTKNSTECSLYITEGHSAAAFARSGRSKTPGGNNKMGIFCLKGKPPNAMRCTTVKLNANDEISGLKRALGLRHGVDYSSEEEIKTLRYGKGIILLCDQDSVTSDTPLLLRDRDGMIDIRTIDDLGVKNYSQVGEKSYGECNYEIWSEAGWTKIRKVMKHKTEKKIYRVQTHTGLVDCTEDHSLVTQNGKEITPEECVVGTNLLHSFPLIKKMNLSNELSVDESFLFGIFFGFGMCSKDFELWIIENINLDLSRKIMRTIERIYPAESHRFIIVKDDETYGLVLIGQDKTTDIISRYRSLFYDFRYDKKVPTIILNSNIKVRRAFYEGVCVYTDDKNNVCGKIGAMGLFYIAKSLGYNVRVNCKNDNSSVFTIGVSENLIKDPYAIRKILRIKSDGYVYDLETENHHFHAGVGEIIVHNTDGFHIAGLVAVFFYKEYKSLVESGFIRVMNTPIMKVFIGRNNPLVFYTQQQYRRWEENTDVPKSAKTRYYKGLATSRKEDAIITFKEPKIMGLITDGSEDDVMDLGFSDKKTDDRKIWLSNYDEETEIEVNEEGDLVEKDDQIEGDMTLSTYVNDRLILYHLDNLHRSLPSVIDGLKESQRKVLYGCFLKNFKTSVKVEQLSGYISENTGYHHGEASLHGAIIKMAQGYVGSHNIPLLYNDGQFGTRNGVATPVRGGKGMKFEGGTDHGAPRYILTRLENITRKIFRSEDDPLLERVHDDGDIVEPCNYVPIIPMILVNGACGIASGYSTDIPPFNPRDIIKWIKIWLDKNRSDSCGKQRKYPKLVPWWRGFKGIVEVDTADGRGVTTHGILEEKSSGKDKVYRVSELPIGFWTVKFKVWIEENLMKEGVVKRYDDFSDTNTVCVDIHTSRDYIPSIDGDFKILSKKFRMTNMVALDSERKGQKFNRVEEIMEIFCGVRYALYTRRKAHLLKELNKSLSRDQNKHRFIKEVIVERTLVLFNKEKDNICEELKTKEYAKMDDGYGYLLSLPFSSLTKSKLKKLLDSIASLETKIESLKEKSEADMWIDDLDEFLEEYSKFLKQRVD